MKILDIWTLAGAEKLLPIVPFNFRVGNNRRNIATVISKYKGGKSTVSVRKLLCVNKSQTSLSEPSWLEGFPNHKAFVVSVAFRWSNVRIGLK